VITCAGPGCSNTLAPRTLGRPARYCSTACRVRDYRHRRHASTAPISVEIDQGSTSSRGRPADRAWLVRIHRGNAYVIVSAGMRLPAAERLAEQLTDLLTENPAETT
jgi:hypothetical protein